MWQHELLFDLLPAVLVLGSGTWLDAWWTVPVRTGPGYAREMRQTLAASDQRRGVGAAHVALGREARFHVHMILGVSLEVEL